MSRIKKLKTHYQEQLTERKIKDISIFIQSILDTDITKGKYARFLIESFLNDKFLEEDLIGGLDSTVGQAISLFDKHKSKLPLEQRSIYALDKETKLPLYQSPGDLWNFVKQFQGELSGKELKKEKQEQIYRETEFIYKDEDTGFQIVSPLTEESAQWWGKGTRWCTSADNDNMFWNYAEDAPLFILLFTDNKNIDRKLQLWKCDNDIQFMDEADNEVTRQYIKENINILKPVIQYIDNIQFFPESYITQEQIDNLLSLDALKENPYIVEHIPDNFITKKVIKDLLSYNQKEINLYTIFSLINKNLLLQSGYQFMIAMLYPKLIADIDKNIIKQDFAKCFLEQYPFLRDIPQDLLTEDMCYNYLVKFSRDFNCIPDKFITDNFCKKIILKNTNIFNEIPEKYKTKELCELALKQSPWNICFIPKNILIDNDFMDKLYKQVILDFRNEKIIMPVNIGINYSNYIRYVPEKYITDDDYKLYIRIFKKTDDFFPKNKKEYYEQYRKEHMMSFLSINYEDFKQTEKENKKINKKEYKKQMKDLKDCIKNNQNKNFVL